MSRDRVLELENRLRRDGTGDESIGASRLAGVHAYVEATEAGGERVYTPRTPRVVAGGVIAALIVGAGVWGLTLSGGGATPPTDAPTIASGATGLLSRERWAPMASPPREMGLAEEARRVSEDVRRLGEAFRSRVASLEQVSARLGSGGLGG